MKKRYFLFTFDQYYPLGGMNDFAGTFDTIEEAFAEFSRSGKDYYQVWDSDAEYQCVVASN